MPHSTETLRLGAFADEISPDLDEQIRVCRENGVTHFELRGVAGNNVLDFDQPLRDEVKRKLSDNGMGVIAIGSPIGKVAIDQPWQAHFDRFKIAVELAEFFDAPLIRVFSYYPAGGEGKGPLDPHREEVIRRFRQKIEYIGSRPITLAHENEKGIFGDIGRRCHELMKTVNSPKLRSAFDFANFVQAGEHPRDNWPLLKPYTAHIHIKDAQMDDGKVVPAGQGDGDIESILIDAYASGYRGFLSMEPHLRVAGHSHGETGPALFKVAVDALRAVCRRANIPLAS
ncbi:MAG: sugar phosphate isomerase/epimerase [Planctomycetota bacterium]|nr:sugar phosphate isomerase/epimerase [Planctomycetota bacterium]